MQSHKHYRRNPLRNLFGRRMHQRDLQRRKLGDLQRYSEGQETWEDEFFSQESSEYPPPWLVRANYNADPIETRVCSSPPVRSPPPHVRSPPRVIFVPQGHDVDDVLLSPVTCPPSPPPPPAIVICVDKEASRLVDEESITVTSDIRCLAEAEDLLRFVVGEHIEI